MPTSRASPSLRAVLSPRAVLSRLLAAGLPASSGLPAGCPGSTGSWVAPGASDPGMAASFQPALAFPRPAVARASPGAAAVAGPLARETAGLFALGDPAFDGRLGGGLPRAALHEIYAAADADIPAATGFAAALALRAVATGPAAGRTAGRAGAGRLVVWVRQDVLDLEAGGVYAPGLAELGLDPADLVLVRGRTLRDVLRAGTDAARCGGVGAVLIEAWGEARALDLTATRRLLLAAQASGAPTLLLRAGVEPAPSAAWTRWRVRAAPSRALAAAAPGCPAFALTLLRHREGIAPHDWRVEWNRDRRCFQEPPRRGAPLPRPVAAVPTDRPAAAGAGLRRAG